MVMVHAENGDAVAKLQEQALARGDVDPIWHAHTRPEAVEAEATASRDPARRDRRHGPGRRPRDLRGRRRRDPPRPRPRPVVHGETCPQYLVMTIDDLNKPEFEGAKYVCSPPLRDASQPRPALAPRWRPASWCSSARTTARSTSRARRSWAGATSRRSRTACPGSRSARRSSGPTACAAGASAPETFVAVLATNQAHVHGLAAAQGPHRPRRRRGHRGVGPRAAAHHHARQPPQRERLHALRGPGAGRRRPSGCTCAGRSPTSTATSWPSPDPASSCRGRSRHPRGGGRRVTALDPPLAVRWLRDLAETDRRRRRRAAGRLERHPHPGARLAAGAPRRDPGRRGPHRPGRQHLGGAAGRERAERRRRAATPTRCPTAAGSTAC